MTTAKTLETDVTHRTVMKSFHRKLMRARAGGPANPVYHPQKLKVAGLAEHLDGQASRREFEQRWRQRSKPAEASSLSSETLERMFGHLMDALSARPSRPVERDQTVAVLMKEENAGRAVDAIRTRLYSSHDHPLAKAGWKALRHVTMRDASHDLEVVWFNPSLSIPRLGIKPGVSLTREQEGVLTKLLGVRSSGPDGANETGDGMATEFANTMQPASRGGRTITPSKRRPDQGRDVVGTATFPVDVGRTVNLNGDALSIINAENGEILPEIALTGIGRLPKTEGQRIWTQLKENEYGLARVSQGVMKSEVGMALQERKARGYVPVAVLRFKSDPLHAIHVRAAPSLVRLSPHLQSDPQKELLMRHLAERAGLMRGYGRALTLKEWAEEFVPRREGLNAGISAESGFTYQAHEGNKGAGEMMDFGEGRIREVHERTAEADVGWHARVVTDIATSVSKLGEEVDVAKAEKRFKRAVAAARAYVQRKRDGTEMKVSAEGLEQIDDAHFSYLGNGGAREEFKESHTYSASGRRNLARRELPSLREEATRLHVPRPERLNRGQLAREIQRRKAPRPAPRARAHR